MKDLSNKENWVDFDGNKFNEVNNTRALEWHNDNPWTVQEWISAMIGESGEAAKVMKKLRRIESGVKFNDEAEKLKDMLVLELADVATYGFIICNEVNRNLWTRITEGPYVISAKPLNLDESLLVISGKLCRLNTRCLVFAEEFEKVSSLSSKSHYELYVANSIAVVVLGCIQIAEHIERDLWKAVVDKFNEVSDRMELKTYYTELSV